MAATDGRPGDISVLYELDRKCDFVAVGSKAGLGAARLDAVTVESVTVVGKKREYAACVPLAVSVTGTTSAAGAGEALACVVPSSLFAEGGTLQLGRKVALSGGDCPMPSFSMKPLDGGASPRRQMEILLSGSSVYLLVSAEMTSYRDP